MSRVQQQDYPAWCDKNERVNQDATLGRGDVVTDGLGVRGVVVKIVPPLDGTLTLEDHGCIYIWRDDTTEYGADNCEHYAVVGWRRNLRILERAGESTCSDDQAQP